MTGTTKAFTLTTTQKRYLEQQLDGVSRSFAIVIPFIEAPLRHYLGVAYLLCRVADNIEDCGQPHPWKKERFDGVFTPPTTAPGRTGSAWRLGKTVVAGADRG